MYYICVFQFLIEIKYPQNWNDHQDWNVELTACKASGYLILHHKAFFIGIYMLHPFANLTTGTVGYIAPFGLVACLVVFWVSNSTTAGSCLVNRLYVPTLDKLFAHFSCTQVQIY